MLSDLADQVAEQSPARRRRYRDITASPPTAAWSSRACCSPPCPEPRPTARASSPMRSPGAVAVLARRGADVTGTDAVPIVARRRSAPRPGADGGAASTGRSRQIAVAVTGTSGKTSVAEFTRQIFAALGRSAASLGTIGVVKPDGSVYGSLTTPDPVTLHQTLAELAAEGVTHLAFEASSHGLDQHRLDGVHIKAAAFTNLGRDHLDYHPTVEDYLARQAAPVHRACCRPTAAAVINADGERAARGGRGCAAARHRCARPSAATATTSAARRGRARRLRAAHGDRARRARVTTCACRWSATIRRRTRWSPPGSPSPPARIAAAVLHGAARPCRASTAGSKSSASATAASPSSTTRTSRRRSPPHSMRCRPFATGKLICVFGCGGDRDKGKRPIMGGIAVAKRRRRHRHRRQSAQRGARPPSAREILADAPGAREIGDRAEAIRHGVGHDGSRATC